MMSCLQDKIILCDLGGVLIELNWLEKAKALFGEDDSLDMLKSKWLKLSSVRLYESGKVSFAEFYNHFQAETGSKIDLVDFKREFAGIIGPVKPDCLEILDYLKQKATLAMLSNTNPVHVQALRESTDIFLPFQHLFLSYEMGMVKPDHEIFKAVCRKLEKPAEEIVFFDHSELNVSSARECGMMAYIVESPRQIKEIIELL